MIVDYTYVPNDKETSIGAHFLKILRLLAGGCLLEKNGGIPNRIASDSSRLNSRLTEEESLKVTKTFQKLLNLTLNGKLKSLLDSNGKITIEKY